MKYIPPTLNAGSFTCPHCCAIANQKWHESDAKFQHFGGTAAVKNVVHSAHCDHCNNYTLWHKDQMIYPTIGAAPPPNPDLPESVSKVYEEAAAISSLSPRGAAGLLRLAIQILCKELGQPGHNINDDIGGLVKAGLPVAVQRSLDIVRVTGNSAVHPGQIDTDDREVVNSLFGLVNVICEYMITLPNRIDAMYSGLPAGTLSAIARRDSAP